MQTVIFKSSRSALSLGLFFFFSFWVCLGEYARERGGELWLTQGDKALLLALCFLTSKVLGFPELLVAEVYYCYIFITFMESGKNFV
jgi:hypothetical protein